MGNALELYFIDTLDGGGRTIAYEVLHDCNDDIPGVEDIYPVRNDSPDDTDPVTGAVREDWLPMDWGGGYYPPGLTQRELINRLVMSSGGVQRRDNGGASRFAVGSGLGISQHGLERSSRARPRPRTVRLRPGRLYKNTGESLMKNKLCIKWLAVGLAVLSFARPVDAVTNDPNAAHKATLERDIGLLKTGQTVNVSYLKLEAARMICELEKSGDRSLLPYLAEKSLNAANPKTVRRRAAAAYVNMADMEETVAFMKKMNAAPSVKGTSWLYFLNRQILGRFAAQEKHMNADTKEKFFSCLLDIIQNSNDSEEAEMANRFLLDRIPEYANSRQRATLCRFANTGNEWVTNTYNPIKAHFDKIPPKQRIDLRKRFPDLPPLTEDKNAGIPLKVALGIGAAFVAVCVGIWIMAKHRKP